MKFERTYSMAVQTDEPGRPNNLVTLGSPFTVEFEIVRNTLSCSNTGRFTIYNLKEDTRHRMYRDRYQTNIYRQVIFHAGYVGYKPLPLSFRGNINMCYSHRRHADYLTVIEAYDGIFGIQNSQIDKSFPAGTRSKDLFTALVDSMKNVAPGKIEDLFPASSRGVTLSGNSWAVLNNLVGDQGDVFVDNEQVHVIKKNSCLRNVGGISVITGDTGLLETPVRHDNVIDLTVLFEPRAHVGQLIQLKSVETVMNGNYKVIGVTHRGTISDAVDRGASTVLTVYAGTQALTEV